MDLKQLSPWRWFKGEDDWGFHHPSEKDLERMFENFFKGKGSVCSKSCMRPHLDIAENKEGYLISVDLPGIKKEDLKVEICDSSLCISGKREKEKEEEGKHFHRVERHYGEFERTLALPEDADSSHIKAEHKNGILEIMVPKKPGVTKPAPKKIEIK